MFKFKLPCNASIDSCCCCCCASGPCLTGHNILAFEKINFHLFVLGLVQAYRIGASSPMTIHHSLNEAIGGTHILSLVHWLPLVWNQFATRARLASISIWWWPVWFHFKLSTSVKHRRAAHVFSVKHGIRVHSYRSGLCLLACPLRFARFSRTRRKNGWKGPLREGCVLMWPLWLITILLLGTAYRPTFQQV